MTKVYRVLHFCLAWLVRIFFRVKIVNASNEPPKDSNFIVCANHLVATDVVVIASALKKHQIHFMAKKELFKVPVLGWLVKGLGAFPVDREANGAGAIFHSAKILKEGKTLGIFPQGTRCKGKDPRKTRIKNGVGMIAIKAEADILPIYIRVKDNTPKAFRRNTVIIGAPIKFEEFGYDPDAKDEYVRISRLIFDRICSLNDEYDAALAEKKSKRKSK